MPTINNQDVLIRVLEKIKELYEEDADFEMTRWLFDWDDSDKSIKLAESAHKEMEALLRLKNRGCIDLRIEENPSIGLSTNAQASPDFKEYYKINNKNSYTYFKKYHGKEDYKLSSFKYRTPESDRSWEYYDWAVWLIGFSLEKFTRTCEEVGIIIGNGKFQAILDVSLGKISIDVGNTRYDLAQLSSGRRVEAIISYCAGRWGQTINLRELKEMPSVQSTTYLTSVFEKNIYFKRDGILKDFIELNTRTIMLKREAYISQQQLNQIINNAKKSESIS